MTNNSTASIGEYYLLDTFTNEIFSGNPTPVCLLNGVLSVEHMHSLAKEFNAPVTVFVEPQQADNIYPIRYFTITGEIPACGHATLGAAFALVQSTGYDHFVFDTIEKTLLHARLGDGALISLLYPRFESTNTTVSDDLLQALGVKHCKSQFFSKELASLFLELHSAEAVKQLAPDFEALKKSSDRIKEVVVMSRTNDQRYDFVLRSFCPWIGIDEDPVTGSIHSVLAHFWQQELGKDQLIAYQHSERGGELFIRPLANNVEIGGHCKLIVKGELCYAGY